MSILSLLLLVVLGILGIAAWLRARRPDLDGPLKKLETVEGWVGIVGLVLGVLGLLAWLSAFAALAAAPLTMLLGLASTLVVLALSLIFAMGLLGTMLGESSFRTTLVNLSIRLAPFKMALGIACLAFAAYSLLRMFI